MHVPPERTIFLFPNYLVTDIPKTSIKTGTTIITRKETKPEKETNSINGNTM